MNIKIKQNIKELRIEAGLRQVDLAKILNGSQRMVSYWELGRTEPSIQDLWNLANLFNVTIDYLVGRNDY